MCASIEPTPNSITGITLCDVVVYKESLHENYLFILYCNATIFKGNQCNILAITSVRDVIYITDFSCPCDGNPCINLITL
jgi:hypothetical protein